MGDFLLSSGASLAFATLVLIAWHLISQKRGWPRRKSDYVWAFIDGGVAYVMAALLIAHNYSHDSYAAILTHGFGEPQVNIAFISALFEALWALWDLFSGNGMHPSPEG